MSLFDIYKAKKLGVNAGSLFAALAGKKLSPVESFNKWDEMLEDGTLDTSTGATIGDGDCLRTKNYTPVLPSTKYFYKAPSKIQYARIYFYDEDMNLVLYRGTRDWLNEEITTRNDAYYMKFVLIKAFYGETYNNDICFNLSGDRNGEYQPHGKP